MTGARDYPRRVVDGGLDVVSCAREPIRIPGSIQPRGVLFVVQPSSGSIIARAGHFGADADKKTNSQTIDEVLGEGVLDKLRQALASDLTGHLGPAQVEGSTYDLSAFRGDGNIIVELEARLAQSEAAILGIEPNVRGFLDEVAEIDALADVLDLAARTIRKLTEFDRVLIYRFENDWSGTVIAESRNEVLPSYLDLRFPASDIPLQARELYRTNRIRIITDANYVPLPIEPSVDPQTGKPIDLSHSILRSVSPVHLQYMRNMGTLASMSVSILLDGRLWGLISCHNATPSNSSHAVRSACDFIAQLLAIRISSIDAEKIAADRRQLSHRYSELLAEMSKADHFVTGLVNRGEDLLELTRSRGAAIIVSDRISTVGETPDEGDIKRISDWLAPMKIAETFATDQLSSQMPDAEGMREIASGLLAISISQLHDSFIIWFRPEIVRSVTWGGDPRKSPDTLTPRSSFAKWKETVGFKSAEWCAAEIEAAGELRTAIVDIVLRNAEELAAMNARLVRANKELEAFSYSVSHDLRAPFRHIVGFAQLLKDLEGDQLSERGNHYIDTIANAAISAGTLVDDLLSFSQMGRVALNPIPVDMNTLVKEVIASLSMEGEHKEAAWNIQKLPDVEADPVLLRVVLQNLIQNALKFSEGQKKPMIEISGHRDDEETIYSVRDNGVGFDMAYAGKLFGVFQRLHRVEDYEGTGIGLANVKRIIERHGGRVWAQGKLDEGAEFLFSLPRVFEEHEE